MCFGSNFKDPDSLELESKNKIFLDILRYVRMLSSNLMFLGSLSV